MSRICDITGKIPLVGNNVSHSKRRVKKRFNPNLHTHRIWLDSEKRFVTLRLSKKGLKTIDKKGLDGILIDDFINSER